MRLGLFLFASALLAFLTLFTPNPSSADDAVLVELFTSQGCSSCPPADQLLSQLGHEPGDVEIIPLAFHVDYWNYIGWKDEFSSPKWSKRQKAYASTISNRTYTPQLVVQGALDCVGSNERCIRQAVERVHRSAALGTVEVERVREVGGSVLVQAVARLGETAPHAVATVAIYESGLSTQVRAGENRGRHLRNDFVVRALQKVGRMDAGDTERRAITARIPVRDEWKLENLGAVVFLQSPDSKRILAAARSEIEDEMAELQPLPKARLSSASGSTTRAPLANLPQLSPPSASVFDLAVLAPPRERTTESLDFLSLRQGDRPWFLFTPDGTRRGRPSRGSLVRVPSSR